MVAAKVEPTETLDVYQQVCSRLTGDPSERAGVARTNEGPWEMILLHTIPGVSEWL